MKRWQLILLSAFFLLMAGASNGVMDTLQFHYPGKWYPAISWKNKYKNNDPRQGPKFFGSKGVFVFLTDGWHLAQWLMLLFFALAITVWIPKPDWWYRIFWIMFVIFIVKTIFAAGFYITWQ